MTSQPLGRILAALAYGATVSVAATPAAQELIAQPRCTLLLIDVHSLRDDIVVRTPAVADAPYLYKGWTQAQKAELSTFDQFAMLRLWDRALFEDGRVESESWQMELMPSSPTALVVRSQGGRGDYDLSGMPLQSLSVFAQGTKVRLAFGRPGTERLEVAWASVYDGSLELSRFLNARPAQAALRVLGSEVRLDLGGEPFAGEARLVLSGAAKSLALVLRRDVGLQVRAPEAVLRRCAAPHLQSIPGGLRSADFERAGCRVDLQVLDAIGDVRVTWEGEAGTAAVQNPAEPAETAPVLTGEELDRAIEAQIAAFLVLASRREYDAAAEKLRGMEELQPGDGRLLFLEKWLREHPNLRFDVVPILGEAETRFREGLDYYVVGQREEALLRFKEAARLDPKLVTAATWARKTAEDIEQQATGGSGSGASTTGGKAAAGGNTAPAGRPAVGSAPGTAERIVVLSSAPVFAVRSPARPSVATRADRIEFTGQVADDVGVDRIEAALNGEPIRDRRGEVVAIRPRSAAADSSRQLEFAFAVPLRPGRNEVVLTAHDVDATAHRTSARFTVLRQPPFYRTGTFAIVLGGVAILVVAAWLVLRLTRTRSPA